MESALTIGGLVFPEMDQTDLTCPFEVLVRMPGAKFWLVGETAKPVRDWKGLILTPETTYAEAPPLDVLVIPGGGGVDAGMEDEGMLNFIRERAAQARLVLTVCTGALLYGAAGLLEGRRATTHWSAHHLLVEFGAIPQSERVVKDGNLISTAGVTAGLDGALLAAAELCGEEAAMRIQLAIEYAPDPPFQSGTPETAPGAVREAVKGAYAEVTRRRGEIVTRVARGLRVAGRLSGREGAV